jgi:hypothetical protein
MSALMNTAQHASTPQRTDADQAWLVVVAAAAGAERVEAAGRSMSYDVNDDGSLTEVQADSDAVLRWCPGSGCRGGLQGWPKTIHGGR